MNLQNLYDNFEIDLMAETDLEEVLSLEGESFTTPWPRRHFEISVDRTEVDAIVVRSRGRLIGYLIGSERDREYLIANLAVRQEYRRQGVARGLIEKALQLGQARGAYHAVLQVRESNLGAIRLYEGLGFQLVRRDPGYYSSPPEDALIMARWI